MLLTAKHPPVVCLVDHSLHPLSARPSLSVSYVETAVELARYCNAEAAVVLVSAGQNIQANDH
jgi:hypothetical protein